MSINTTNEVRSKTVPTPSNTEGNKFHKVFTSVSKLYDESGEHTGKLALTVTIGKTVRVVELDGNALKFRRTAELAEVLSRLDLSDGFNSAEIKQLAEAISSMTKDKAFVLRRPGFHKIHYKANIYRCFVWNNEIHWITDAPRRDVVLLGTARMKKSAAGSFEDWTKTFNSIIAGNPYLLFMLGAALSAALVRVLQLEPLQLIVVGESSSGKTASQRLIKSIFSAPYNIQSASGTSVGLQQFLSRCPDTPAIVQEMRQLRDPEGLVALMFELANCAARQVGTADQTGIGGANLATVLIGSNEVTLAELAMLAKCVLTPDWTPAFSSLLFLAEKTCLLTNRRG